MCSKSQFMAVFLLADFNSGSAVPPSALEKHFSSVKNTFLTNFD